MDNSEIHLPILGLSTSFHVNAMTLLADDWPISKNIRCFLLMLMVAGYIPNEKSFGSKGICMVNISSMYCQMKVWSHIRTH